MSEKTAATEVEAEEDSLEELERQLANHQARREQVQHFVDSPMREMQTRWTDNRIAEVEKRIQTLRKRKPKAK